MSDLSERDRAGLSELEIAALEEDTPAEELNSSAESEPDTDETTESKDEAKPAADAATAKDEPVESEDTDERESPFVPVYQAQIPEDLDSKLAELSTRDDELAKKFQDSDITFEQYRKEQAALIQERNELQTARTKAEISAEMSQQTSAQKWQWEVDHFMKDALKSDGIDYKKNRILNAALDIAVKDLAADPAHADKDGEWFLSEAHKAVKEQLGVNRAKPTLSSVKSDPVKQAVAERNQRIPAPPKTLSSLPAAQEPEVGQDEFSAIDRLADTDVIAFERALAKLPPDAAARYLRVGAG